MTTIDYAQVYAGHADYLWGLCYRMTGDATEADDLVQETFARALQSPPPDPSRPWRPWLATVASRLSIDRLRRRRRRAYDGPWLPTPIDTPSGSVHLQPIAPEPDAEVRYDTLQSLSFGFLLALETLTPMQRAVLLLRDAFGYTGPETAEMLDLSEANVRVTLHRARKAMAQARAAEPSPVSDDVLMSVVARFVAAAAAGDVDGVEACLTEDARLLSDGGGEFVAARKPIDGRRNVARFYAGVSRHAHVAATQVRPINGAPAVFVRLEPSPLRQAPVSVTLIELAADGRIRTIYGVLASAKLAALQLD